MKVAYPGSSCIADFDSLGISRLGWLLLVMKKGIMGDARDINSSGLIKRITFGWSQKQSKSLGKSVRYKNEIEPYPSFPEMRGRNILTKQMKVELGKIMSMSQAYLDKFYSNKKMNDKERNKQFGNEMAKSFWQFSTSRFEFVTIFVETDAIVGRHMDYMNSKDDQYNVGCSYSYLIEHVGKVFRVNFIMCNRLQVDAFMEKIANYIEK